MPIVCAFESSYRHFYFYLKFFWGKIATAFHIQMIGRKNFHDGAIKNMSNLTCICNQKCNLNVVFLLACDCNEFGSLSSNCDPITGQCPCKDKYVGRTCSQCKVHIFQSLLLKDISVFSFVIIDIKLNVTDKLQTV
jgi:hypothetical protein